MFSSLSFAVRALLAVVLMIGFYLLALAIALGLLYIPYAGLVYARSFSIQLTLICVVGGLAILWSVVPRVDKFRAPGPRLTREQQPRLFEEIESIARSAKQKMPADVFLVGDLNAWVAQRGGLMGIGSRRVMGLGLPLMHLLTRSQLRAVLAHEFGHFHGGDTKLGPWIYKTRGAIGRTVGSLQGRRGKRSLLQLPFLLYGKLYLRITQAISRHQEIVADELAARVAGPQTLINGLRLVYGATPAFQHYWVNECAPVLEAGFRPPIGEGFHAFVQSERVSGIINQQIEETLKTAKSNPYDSHPPLKERIRALERLPAGGAADADQPALTLLDDLPALEFQLISSMAGPQKAGKLKACSWDEVRVRQWTQLVRGNGDALKGVTPESLPTLAVEGKSFGRKLVTLSGQRVSDANLQNLAGAVVGAALALTVVAKGGKAVAIPGQEPSVTLGSACLEPFSVWKALGARELVPEVWEQRCRELGILGVDLWAPSAV